MKVPLRRVAAIEGGGTPSAQEENWGGPIPFVTPPDLRPVVGGVVESTTRSLTESGAARGSNIVPANSVILSIRAPIGYVARTVHPASFNQGCRALTGLDKTQARYLTYALIAASGQLAALGRGTTFQEVSAAQLATLEVPNPPAAQQRAIANYLDRETAQIDTLIEEQQRLQALLAERRCGLIDQALFAPGVEDTVPLKHMVRAVDQGVSPQAEGALAEDPASWGVLKAGCVNGGHFRPEEHKRLDKGFEFDHRLEVKAGDLLVSRASGSPNLVGSAGIVTRSKYRLILSDKTFRLLPTNSFSTDYLHLLLNSSLYREQVRAAISGADGLANNLPLSRLLNMRFPVIESQARAESVRRVRSDLAMIDRTVSEVETFVALTRERRSALITAAVTGTLDLERP